MRRTLLLGAAAVMIAAGCTNRMEPIGPSAATGRMYSTHVAPVTGSPKCVECHQTDDKNKKAPANLGTYSTDSLYFNGIKKMFTDPTYSGELEKRFTAEEIKNVLDWLAASRPNDPKTF